MDCLQRGERREFWDIWTLWFIFLFTFRFVVLEKSKNLSQIENGMKNFHIWNVRALLLRHSWPQGQPSFWGKRIGLKIYFLFCYLNLIVGWRNPFHVTSKYIRFKSHEILIKFAVVKFLGIVTFFGTFGNFVIWHLAKRGPLRAMGPQEFPIRVRHLGGLG